MAKEILWLSSGNSLLLCKATFHDCFHEIPPFHLFWVSWLQLKFCTFFFPRSILILFHCLSFDLTSLLLVFLESKYYIHLNFVVCKMHHSSYPTWFNIRWTIKIMKFLIISLCSVKRLEVQIYSSTIYS